MNRDALFRLHSLLIAWRPLRILRICVRKIICNKERSPDIRYIPPPPPQPPFIVGLLLKGSICSLWEQMLSFKEKPILEPYVCRFLQVCAKKNSHSDKCPFFRRVCTNCFTTTTLKFKSRRNLSVINSYKLYIIFVRLFLVAYLRGHKFNFQYTKYQRQIKDN